MASKPTPTGPAGPAAPRTALQALFAGDGADPLRRALWLDALDNDCVPTCRLHLPRMRGLRICDGGQARFIVDSPVWRAKLRLAPPELIHAARSIGVLNATKS